MTLVLDQKDDESKCAFNVKKKIPTTDLNVTVFDVPPPLFPNRITILQIQLVSETKMHAVFGGNTMPFRTAFENLNVPVRSFKKNASDLYNQYVRTVEHMDMEEPEECIAKLTEILKTVLKSSPIIVRMHDSKVDPKNLKTIMESIKHLPNVRLDF